MLRFSGGGASDVGLVREHNEDSAFLGPYVALVADGVGGAAAGEVASATAAHVVAARLLARSDEPLETVLQCAGREALLMLARGIEHDPERAGMATTLSALACDGRRVVMAHVGDSRAYLLREGSLTRLSIDHTYVQSMVASGQLTPDQARVHRWRNVVLRSLDGDLGVEEPFDVAQVPCGVGDRLLLCSDGLSDLVADDAVARLLAIEDPDGAAAGLVRAAVAAGGRDNVTCLVLDLVEGPEVAGDGRVLGALADPANVVDPSAVPRG